MSGFAARIFAPKGNKPKQPPLPNQASALLALTLKNELLKPQYNPVQILLRTPGQEPLTVSVDKVKDTAGIGTWLKNVAVANGKIVAGELHAVSLILTGIDKNADDDAINQVETRLDQAGRKLIHVEKFADEARKEVRPILMTLCQNYEISTSAMFIASTEALAQAWMDQFGAQGDEAEFNRAKQR